MGYLALEREVDERVVISVPPHNRPTRITVVVASVRAAPGRAKLAFEAPAYVIIDRDEVDQAKEREKAAKLVTT